MIYDQRFILVDNWYHRLILKYIHTLHTLYYDKIQPSNTVLEYRYISSTNVLTNPTTHYLIVAAIKDQKAKAVHWTKYSCFGQLLRQSQADVASVNILQLKLFHFQEIVVIFLENVACCFWHLKFNYYRILKEIIVFLCLSQ